MTTLLLIRHGESIANQQRIFCGQSDYDLTETGFLQAQGTAEYISTHYRVTHVYASDLVRALHTGEAIGEKAACPVTPDPRLREIHCGEWELIPFDELLPRWPDTYPTWLYDIGRVQCPGGESVTDVLNRVLPALTEYAQRHPGETIAAATHGTVIRALLCVLSGQPLSEMKAVPWPHNASVTEVSYDKGEWRIVLPDYDAHLSSLRTWLPDTV